jgi:hypothetical protein
MISGARCATCRYWSDKLAYANVPGPMFAYCLMIESPRYGKVNGDEKRGYTSERDGCEKHETGRPIDE